MINCLIIEDEPLAADVMIDYTNQISYLNVKGICRDALEGTKILRTESIDLIFLDLHLPGLKGLDFLSTLKNPPAVIVTTAYHEYALRGYEFNIVDYLLKPFSFKRFLEAINKLSLPPIASSGKEKISVQSEKKTVLIPVNEILFIESQKEYIKIQTTSASHVTKYALSKIEAELNSKFFLRVHRSFIVGIENIKAFNSNEIEIAGKIIPIGGNYREIVAQKLQSIFAKTLRIV